MKFFTDSQRLSLQVDSQQIENAINFINYNQFCYKIQSTVALILSRKIFLLVLTKQEQNVNFLANFWLVKTSYFWHQHDMFSRKCSNWPYSYLSRYCFCGIVGAPIPSLFMCFLAVWKRYLGIWDIFQICSGDSLSSSNISISLNRCCLMLSESWSLNSMSPAFYSTYISPDLFHTQSESNSVSQIFLLVELLSPLFPGSWLTVDLSDLMHNSHST